MKKLFMTNESDYTLLILRIALAAVMLPHGLQKTLGYFDGPGFDGAMSFLTGLGIPAIIAMLVILAESLGALGLLFGFLTRFCAAAIAVDMIGAVLLVHAKNGFFAGGGGYEYHIALVGIGIVLLMNGGGAWSIDGIIQKKLR